MQIYKETFRHRHEFLGLTLQWDIAGDPSPSMGWQGRKGRGLSSKASIAQTERLELVQQLFGHVIDIIHCEYILQLVGQSVQFRCVWLFTVQVLLDHVHYLFARLQINRWRRGMIWKMCAGCLLTMMASHFSLGETLLFSSLSKYLSLVPARCSTVFPFNSRALMSVPASSSNLKEKMNANRMKNACLKRRDKTRQASWWVATYCHYFNMTGYYSNVNWKVVDTVFDVRIGSVLKQKANDCWVATRAGDVQTGSLLLVEAVDVVLIRFKKVAHYTQPRNSWWISRRFQSPLFGSIAYQLWDLR